MSNTHPIVHQVEVAQVDLAAADDMIREYMPFIRSETAKFLNRPPVDSNDDELSIAMIAFHEAIQGYERQRGSFLAFAAQLIRNRLIDYYRKEKWHRGVLSLNEPVDGDDGYEIMDTLAEPAVPQQELETRQATRAEIQELSAQMAEFGVTFADVADNCPRQERTLEACRRVLAYAKEHGILIKQLLHTKRLPVSELAAGSGVARKTIERHRNYIVTLLLIWSNGYELIRGHLVEVLRKGGRP
ncbi:MAG: sigma-70 family RNA polymerase sigma factor [Fastidiosipilaceae bacterium]|nr:sigma-70 family RNA polymerase sigma factor [Clostridiaceae bacterium]